MLAAALALAAATFVVRPATADDSNVTIRNDATAVPNPYSYSPATAYINLGDRVTWTNVSNVTHTVTSPAGTPLDSGNMSPGATYSHTFVKEGTFPYHCTIHNNMQGSVVVTEAVTTTLAPATTTTHLVTTSSRATTTSRPTTSTTATVETIDLDTTTVPEQTTTTAGQVAIKTNNGGTNGAAVAILVLAIGAILGGGGYLLYRLRTGRF
jgi:plastocyanin